MEQGARDNYAQVDTEGAHRTSSAGLRSTTSEARRMVLDPSREVTISKI